MKSLFAIAAIALLCVAFGWAQQQSDQSAGLKVRVGTVKGCLDGSRGNYLLTQDGSGTLFRLVGNDGQLKSHLGQEVLVTGQLPGSGPAPSAVGESAATERGSVGSSTSGNVIQVSKVQTVSKACTTAGAPASSY
jgi:hypothetical protein